MSSGKKAEMEFSSVLHVHDASMFEPGNGIMIGDWPRWMYRWHVPYFVRRSIRIVGRLFGKNIGPRFATITKVSGSKLTITNVSSN